MKRNKTKWFGGIRRNAWMCVYMRLARYERRADMSLDSCKYEHLLGFSPERVTIA